jgi:hypothetical protein
MCNTGDDIVDKSFSWTTTYIKKILSTLYIIRMTNFIFIKIQVKEDSIEKRMHSLIPYAKINNVW